MIVRAARDDELDHLARLWHDAWRDGHEHIAPPGLVRARTLPRFRARLAAMLADVRVAGPAGAPLGFYALKGDELYQLFVARAARGSDVAAALLDDGEAELARRGVTTAWLACAVGNDRAARFYEKRGWTRAGTQAIRLETEDGVFEVEHWRFEKMLAS
jgi:GNAT superfamily N-acetyltransferase